MIAQNAAVRCHGSVLLAHVLCAQAVLGQEQAEKPITVPLAQAGSETPAGQREPLSGPKYLNLRYDKAFGTTEPANDTFTLYRYFVHADLKFRDLFRVFVQGAVVHDEDRDLTPLGIDENIGDLQQLFFDLRILGEDVPWKLRVGRQELQYGAQRVVSPLEWASTRRRFDAVKLFWRNNSWNVDTFYAKPVPVQRRQRDRFDEEFDFYGLYATYRGIPRHIRDFHFFEIDNTGNPTKRYWYAGRGHVTLKGAGLLDATDSPGDRGITRTGRTCKATRSGTGRPTRGTMRPCAGRRERYAARGTHWNIQRYL